MVTNLFMLIFLFSIFGCGPAEHSDELENNLPNNIDNFIESAPPEEERKPPSGGISKNGNISNYELLQAMRASKAVWDREKASKGANYIIVHRGASWVGTSWTTTVAVRNDVVTGRSYESSWGDRWNETGDQIGSHEGAPAITIDEIYQQCEQILTMDIQENYLTFLPKNGNGIITDCSYFPKNCADDCSEGFSLQVKFKG